MILKERRTVYEIYWEILVYCKTPRLSTQIVQRCDLNSKTCQGYLDFLLGKGYIRSVTESSVVTYQTTAKAGDYLSVFVSMYQELYGAPLQFRIKSTN
ncbi:winged helix-turn-helix domain-containing protein [[Eubacterium] cellulosolvens]